jgi:lipopolysaccharide transport system ATP-binding protein
MSNLAISIQNLTKEYKVTKGKKKEIFKALDNINLDIEKGKVTGLIGANGAGKSTLLKILSRITYPTHGKITLNGRMASLLEVGTGFHPDLSGRENIFLNGAILGMSRSEIQSQFDEIVDFSGVEDFLDNAVKHYSSGMYVRLAFSVAAHLRSEILLVDEVLAVGDAEFQKKCLGKMNEATKEVGRTIIFVSHNLAAMRELSQTVVWLNHGKIHQLGHADDVCNNYLNTHRSFASNTPIEERKDRNGSGHLQFSNLCWHTPNDDILITGKPAKMEIQIKSKISDVRDLHIRLNIVSSEGLFITTLSNLYSGYSIANADKISTLYCNLPKLNLIEGNYSIMASIFANGQLQDRVREAMIFEVVQGDFFDTGRVFSRRKEGVETPQQWHY